MMGRTARYAGLVILWSCSLAGWSQTMQDHVHRHAQDVMHFDLGKTVVAALGLGLAVVTAVADTDSRRPSGWLRNAQFDSVLIGGVLAFALLLGAVAMQDASLFAAVLLVDVWLLAYPHVASSFSRIAFDRRSAPRSKSPNSVAFSFRADSATPQTRNW